MLSASATAPIVQATDFPDRMNPMLVKELRQGLRSHAFVISFALSLVALSLLVGMETLMYTYSVKRDSYHFDKYVLEVLFWVSVAIPIHLLLPFRHLLSGDEDVQSDQLPLLRLTKINPERIAMLKWRATMTLGLVYLSALAPFILLRYFLGSRELILDLLGLIWLLVGMSILSALGGSIATVGKTGRITWGALLLIGLPIFESLLAWGAFACHRLTGNSIGVLTLWIVGGSSIFGISISLASDRYCNPFHQTSTSDDAPSM